NSATSRRARTPRARASSAMCSTCPGLTLNEAAGGCAATSSRSPSRVAMPPRARISRVGATAASRSWAPVSCPTSSFHWPWGISANDASWALLLPLQPATATTSASTIHADRFIPCSVRLRFIEVATRRKQGLQDRLALQPRGNVTAISGSRRYPAWREAGEHLRHGFIDVRVDLRRRVRNRVLGHGAPHRALGPRVEHVDDQGTDGVGGHLGAVTHRRAPGPRAVPAPTGPHRAVVEAVEAVFLVGGDVGRERDVGLGRRNLAPAPRPKLLVDAGDDALHGQ